MLYIETAHRTKVCVCAFHPKAIFVHRVSGHYVFALEEKAYFDIWSVLYLFLSYKCSSSFIIVFVR